MEMDIGTLKWNLNLTDGDRKSNYSKSEGSVDESDTQSVTSDGYGDDNDDDRQSNDSDDMKGFGDIEFVGHKIYKRTDSDLDLDNGDIEIDDDVYKLCGYV